VRSQPIEEFEKPSHDFVQRDSGTKDKAAEAAASDAGAEAPEGALKWP